jgi:hypothetical protein
MVFWPNDLTGDDDAVTEINMKRQGTAPNISKMDE